MLQSLMLLQTTVHAMEASPESSVARLVTHAKRQRLCVQATFTVQTASHLGPLTQLTVSHEQPGQGWLLERMEVTDDGTGLLYIFFCGELLDASTSKVLQVMLFCSHLLCSISCAALPMGLVVKMQFEKLLHSFTMQSLRCEQ